MERKTNSLYRSQNVTQKEVSTHTEVLSNTNTRGAAYCNSKLIIHISKINILNY